MTTEAIKILSRTLEIYMKYGIKSVTMDDVARELGISKKTLYQYFDNKKDLVFKTVQYYIDLECESIVNIKKASDSAIDEMFSICHFFSQFLRERNPSLMLDMQKYHPESWELFKNHKQTFAYQHVVDNINAGIKEGMYRRDFDIDIVAKLYISRIEAIIDNQLFPYNKYPLMHVVLEMICYHIRGIATPAGMQYLEEKKKTLNLYEK